jgi:hypothetical protein
MKIIMLIWNSIKKINPKSSEINCKIRKYIKLFMTAEMKGQSDLEWFQKKL